MAQSGLVIRVAYTSGKTLVAMLMREDGLVWDNAVGSWIALEDFVSSSQGVELAENDAPLTKSYSGVVERGKLGTHSLAVYVLDYTGSPFCIGVGPAEVVAGNEAPTSGLTPQQAAKLQNLDVPVSSRVAAPVNAKQFGVGVL